MCRIYYLKEYRRDRVRMDPSRPRHTPRAGGRRGMEHIGSAASRVIARLKE